MQLQHGAGLSLQDDLQMEYRLSQRFVEDKDFYEGVRAGQLVQIIVRGNPQGSGHETQNSGTLFITLNIRELFVKY